MRVPVNSLGKMYRTCERNIHIREFRRMIATLLPICPIARLYHSPTPQNHSFHWTILHFPQNHPVKWTILQKTQNHPFHWTICRAQDAAVVFLGIPKCIATDSK